jgi:hypothetical protein
MKTEDFIQLLSSDRNVPSTGLERGLAIALAAGFVIAAVLFWIALGPRPDIAQAAETPRFLAKVVISLLLAATATVLCVRLMRPGAPRRIALVAMAAAPLALAVAVLAELALVPSSEWQADLVGSNSLVCLTAIPLLALPILGCVLYALRQGAPTRPGLAGAVGGLLAGGLAAALYALQCTDDSPLFIVTWYILAIAAVTLIGTLAGRRLLRW